MSNNKSSLSMEDEISGYGQTVYLDASYRQTYPPLSQENVTLSPDFTDSLLKVLGSMQIVIDPTKMDMNILGLVVGAMPHILQMIVTKNPITGLFVIKFIVAGSGLTTGSYLQDIQMASNGAASVIGVTGRWEKDDKGWRYFQDGYLKNSWLKTDAYYYLDNDGYMVTGWNKIDKEFYYFHSNGKLAVNEWIPNGDNWFYCRSNGEMLKDDFRKGSDGKWYYCGPDGKMVKGETVITWRGNQYYLYSDGSMAENKTVTYQGKTYTANSKGELTEVSGQETEDYFVIIKRGTLQIRKNTTARDNTNILEKLSPGKAIKIVIPQNIVENEGISWIQVYVDSSKTEKGWVDKTLIYPDKPIETLYLNHPTIDYRNVEGEFNGTPKSLDYIDIWGRPGQGNYSSG